MKLISEGSQKIAERLTWCTASRDQPGIASNPRARKYPKSTVLETPGFLTSSSVFLEELGIMKLLTGLDPGRNKRSSNIQFPAVILIYLMRIVAGLRFFWHIDPVILSSQSLMRLVGFNGRQRSVKGPPPEERSRIFPGRVRIPINETVFVFKIRAVWDAVRCLPLALSFATIEVSDIDHFAREVVQQAVTNLADHATIVSLAMDRGFTDGKINWRKTAGTPAYASSEKKSGRRTATSSFSSMETATPFSMLMKSSSCEEEMCACLPELPR